MEFQILSHAGLRITQSGKTVLFDPWLIGSTYWRSWWNYPPVEKSLVDELVALKPAYIVLTHIHWDHFQGPSLRKFPKDTPIIVPWGGARRMKRDLNQIGFKHVIEMRHGASLQIAPDFKITSYQFSPFMDSGLVVECGETVLFNANDAKFMGGPLAHILKRHPRIDFVLRSHSSANARASYTFTDSPAKAPDDNDRYVREFAAFASKCGARFAIPFASNHCLLHREAYAFNASVTTPVRVRDYCQEAMAGGESGRWPEVKVMLSGDCWSAGSGFKIADKPWFTEREGLLAAYAREKAPVLEAYYQTEARTDLPLTLMQRYFAAFSHALPRLVRRQFKGHPVTYVVHGKRSVAFEVDLHTGRVREFEATLVNDTDHPLQIRTSALILRQCVTLNLFLHLGISKRVTYRCTVAGAKTMWLLDFMFNMYESEMLPLRKLLGPRNLMTWLPRWRELLLYASIVLRKLRGKPFSTLDYLT
jgi:UDP-MurNAc hydroxylase